MKIDESKPLRRIEDYLTNDEEIRLVRGLARGLARTASPLHQSDRSDVESVRQHVGPRFTTQEWDAYLHRMGWGDEVKRWYVALYLAEGERSKEYPL